MFNEDVVAVSIVMTVFNAAEWLDDSLCSILHQTFTGSLEVSVYNDASSDSTAELLKMWQQKFSKAKIQMVISSNEERFPLGVGYGRNRAIEQSKGEYLCFFDADDVMCPERIELQYAAATTNPPNALIGSNFTRIPPESTHRYTRWHNNLSKSQLYSQAFTAFGPTLIQPTWFCSRKLFEKTGGAFSEEGKGSPEDLIFFYRHLSQEGLLLKVNKDLLIYRYHHNSQSFSIKRETIWTLRVNAIQDQVLWKWTHFTIWNAGKQGRRLYRSLRPQNRAKVVAFCDVDRKKIDQGFYTHEESKETPKPKIPIIHYSSAKPPIVLCVKLDLTGGEFEKNLASLELQEAVDYYHFS